MKGFARSKGFSLVELIITFALVAILGAIAWPAYKNYNARTYYANIAQSTVPYRVAVAQCIQNLKTLTGCDAGKNNIPASITQPKGLIHSLSVVAGVITVTPVAAQGITLDDTYILTPDLNSKGAITWKTSGKGVVRGYAS